MYNNYGMESIPARDIPVMGDYDVIVCGAGPAGIGAAVAAGRAGARTLLIERLYHVGGLATNVTCWCDTQGGAIFDELEDRVSALGRATRTFNPEGHLHEKGRVVLRGETVKAVALRMIREAGSDVLFGTTVAEAWMRDGNVCGVIIANKGGLSLAKARVVIDATADADVAASSGARFLKGDPDDGRLMHVNFKFRMDKVDQKKYNSEEPSEETLIELIKAAHKSGELHVPRGVFLPQAEYFPYDITWKRLFLSGWEIEKVDGSDPIAVSDKIAECQLIALEVVEFCRRYLPGHENCGIDRFWELLGVRESRRIVGKYILTRDDVLAGRKFDDGIAQACFFIDFHDSPPGDSIPYDIEFKKKNRPPVGDWYEIPYRSLLPEKIGGLLVAGRCISVDRSALASMRVMPSCIYTGEAAGTAAALAVSEGILPHEVKGEEVKRRVIKSS